MLNSSVMLGNYLQQTTSANDIFRRIVGALRVNMGFRKKAALSNVFDCSIGLLYRCHLMNTYILIRTALSLTYTCITT